MQREAAPMPRLVLEETAESKDMLSVCLVLI